MSTHSQRMPAAFIGHGSPMNALESNRFSQAWAAFGRSVPRPRAILAISAHWHVNATAVTAMERPRTIHDFFGFPQRLFDVDYPAPGSAAIAEEIADVAKPARVGLDHDSWGIDHGTWSVLVHMFPKADVPVLQLSIHAQENLDFHIALGAKLAPLREKGILIVGSGNVVHNLRMLDWSKPALGFDWAQRFDEKAREILMRDPSALAQLKSHPDYAKAVPTDEHFLPFLYFAGLASAAGTKPESIVDGCAFGSLSMAAYALEADLPKPGASQGPSAGGPTDPLIPAKDTNL